MVSDQCRMSTIGEAGCKVDGAVCAILAVFFLFFVFLFLTNLTPEIKIH